MHETLQPDDAARALDEIGQRRDQVIKLALIPWWYWWVLGGLTVGLSAAVESNRPLAIGLGVSVFVLGMLIATGWIVVGMLRHAQPRSDLIGPTGVLAILGFVAAVVGVTLPATFLLQGAGARYPATLAQILGAVIMIIGGPVLMRFLRDRMAANRPGGQP